MPPIKGRMMGRMSRAGDSNEFSRAKNLGLSRKRSKLHFHEGKSSGKLSSELKDEKLLKLRIPASICCNLPSVKRFKGSKSFVDLTDEVSSLHSEESELSWDEKPFSQQILGIKRTTRGYVTGKYFVRPMSEDKFNGMIWDIAFSPSGSVLVSCGDGILLCDHDLKVQSKLENIILAGGLDFLSNGNIVAICRNTDTVNVFSPGGVFIRSFPAGFSPMAVTVNTEDELIVCDPGSKSVCVYTADGELVKTIGPEGSGFKLRWPLYASCSTDGTILVSDCHSQKVLVFDSQGEYVRDMKLNTSTGSQLLRPHGLCVNESNDRFVLDMATDTVEIFSDNDDYIQTLIPGEEGHSIRPKIVRIGHENGYLAIGGLTGVVKLYEFVSEEELKRKPKKTPTKTPTKRSEISRTCVKEEVKIEPIEIEERIILDDDDDDDDEDDDEEEEVGKEEGQDCEEPELIESDIEENEVDEDIVAEVIEGIVETEQDDLGDSSPVNSHVPNTVIMNGDSQEEEHVILCDSDDEEEEEAESEMEEQEAEESPTKTNISFVMEQVSEGNMNGFQLEEVMGPQDIIVLDD